MEIIRLPEGEIAPRDSDCVSIDRAADGRYVINASVLLDCGDGEEAESVALIASEPYPSYEDAEAAGLAWAEGHCVPQLYVSTETGQALREFAPQ